MSKKLSILTSNQEVGNLISKTSSSKLILSAYNDYDNSEAGKNSFIFDLTQNQMKMSLHDIDSDVKNEKLLINQNNIVLEDNVSITGTLTTENLNVTGTTTTINTNQYNTENLVITNDNGQGPALKIDQNNQLTDIINIVDNSTNILKLTSSGNLGIGIDPTSELHVFGDINYTGKLLKNGSESASSGTIYKGMIVEMKHNDYKKMQYAAPNLWSPIDNDLTTGFVINIKPKSIYSLISLYINCYISFDHTDDARWWGARLYRKIGDGDWTHVTGAGGNRTGDDVNDVPSSSGTSVWFGDNNLASDYSEIGNCSASYLDTPNTLEEVYYTIYWKCRLGAEDVDKNISLNRSIEHGDSFRSEPISSWTIKEIWNDGNPYTPVDSTISISGENVGINNINPQYNLDVSGNINFTGNLTQNNTPFSSFNDEDAILLLNSGYDGGHKINSGNLIITKEDSNIFYVNIGKDQNNANVYTFNNINYETETKLYLNTGTYYFKNIPESHPLGFVINDTSLFEVTSGTLYSNQNVLESITVNYYTGDITVEVKNDFGTISYACYFHGYMGGNQRLEYSTTEINGGRIGIGTNKPTYKLEIGENSTTHENKDNIIALSQQQFSKWGIGITKYNKYPTASNGSGNYDFEISPLAGSLGNILLIPKGGYYVGINKTNPQYTLDINGNINFSGQLTKDGTPFTSYTDSNVETLLSTTNKKIGIGITADANATLTIKGETKFLGTDRNSHINYLTDEHTYIRGGKNTSYVLLNDNGGNVGVGTGTPNYTLDINGNINFSGQLTKDGTPFTSYSDAEVVSLLNSGVSGGIISINDLIVYGDLKSVTQGSSDPSTIPSVSINDIGNSKKTVVFENLGDNETQYNVTFSNNTVCDILVVAGGGSGGQYGGGGGGGDVLYFQNITLNGSYDIKVGKGGYGNSRDSASHGGGESGFNSSIIGGIINIIAGGGGGGAGYGNFDGKAKAIAGTVVSYTNPITQETATSSGGGGGTIFQNNEFASGNTVSGDGADNLGSNHAGGGGGGAGGITDGSIGDAPDKPAQGIGGDGGIGLAIDISGTLTEYGGGGGGGDWTADPAQPGNGVYGGGNGSYNAADPGNGINGTGGGGGGRGSSGSADYGQGGTGIVIIRYTGTTENIIVSYSDEKVENVLANKGGNNITWNTSTKQFDCDVINTDVDVSQENFNSKLITRLNSDVTFNGNINIQNNKFIKFGGYSFIGEDIHDLDSLSIIANSTERICFGIYDGTGVGPTSTNTTEYMRIDENGKVGIGLTNPSEKLHIKHSQGITSPIDLLSLEHNLTNNTTHNGSSIKFIANWQGGDKHTIARIRGLSNDSTALPENYFSGFLIFETQTGGTANDITTERMRITNRGNVGIGIENPSEILHILGNFKIETRANETSSIDIKSDTGGFKIKYDDTNNNLKFITDNSGTEYELLTMDRTNNRIGIGTNLPEEDLHIKNGRIKIEETSGNPVIHFKNNYNTYLFTENNTGKFVIRNNDDKDTVIDSTGNVGIGITTPSDKLEVNGSSTIIKTSDNSGGGGLYFAHITNQRTWNLRMEETVKNLHFDCYTNTWNTNMTLLTNGNVGIGISSPTSKLDVNGNTNVNGNVTATSLNINGDTNITGTLTTANLSVTGTTTTINTNQYNTENLVITNDNGQGPAFKIDQNGETTNIIEILDNTTNILKLTSSGNLGIGLDPVEKLDVDGNIKFTGTINSITSTEISYLDGLTQNIENNFIITSNHIGLADANNSNYIKDTSNILTTRIEVLEDNSTVNATDIIGQITNSQILNIDAQKIVSGFIDVNRLPVDGITIFRDGDVIKASTGGDISTLNTIDTFIGTYFESIEYSENLENSSNTVILDNNKLYYDKSIITSEIETIKDSPKFYTSEIIYPNNILNFNDYVFSEANQSFNDGNYQINIIISDGVNLDNFQRYGPHQLFNHILEDSYYISGVAFNQDGIYLGTNNFKNTIGLSISIDLGRSIYLRKMRFMPANNNTASTSMPKYFKIFATNLDSAWNSPYDGSWTLIHDNTTEIQYNNKVFTNFGDFNNITLKYRYFTLVVTELNGSGRNMQMTEFSIIGVEDINNLPVLVDAFDSSYSIILPYNDTTITKNLEEPKIKLEDNLIAYYDFNNNYDDKNPTNTKYNLSVSESPEFSQNIQIENQSIYFNQFNEFLSTSINLPITFGTSFSFWFKRDNNETHDILMAIGADFFIMAHTENKFYISNTYGGTEIYAFLDVTLTTEWYHFVFIFDTDGTWKIYLNSIWYPFTLTGGDYPITESRLPQGKLYIGGKDVGYWDGDHDLEGYIDNFRVYNKILNQYEIITIYNNSINDLKKLEFNENKLSYYDNLLFGLKAHYELIYNYIDNINNNNIIASANSSFNHDELYYLNIPTNEYVTIPNTACSYLFDTNNESTFAFWVKVDSTTDDGNAIFGAIKNYGDGLYSRYICQLSGTTLHWTRNYKRDAGGTLQDDASISCVLPNNLINKWIHLAFVSYKESDEFNHSKIFINGVSQLITHEYGLPDNNDISSYSDYLEGENLLLGGYIHSTGATYHGGNEQFSDIRIYNRALSDNEIKKILNNNFIKNVNIDNDYNAIILKYNPINTDFTEYLLNFDKNTLCDILIIGGGGGGGARFGGGGGAGLLIYETNKILNGNITIKVGKGGLGGQNGSGSIGTNGEDTLFITTTETLTAIGGGGGGHEYVNGNAGGSGGGGTYQSSNGGTGSGDNITTFGNDGGDGYYNGVGTRQTGGGGGAGGSGKGGIFSERPDGGRGKEINITGTNIYYAGGGGGANSDYDINGYDATGLGGENLGGGWGGIGGGGGGDGGESTPLTQAQNGVPGSGGGGGGSVLGHKGGNGGSGTVIIKYKKTLNSLKYNIIPPNLKKDSENLIAKYDFEYNYNDSSSNNHHLVNYNTYLTYENKVYDNCSVLFKKLIGESYLEFPDTINLYDIWNLGEGLTISLWFYMYSDTDNDGTLLEFAYQTIKFNTENEYYFSIKRNLLQNQINIYWKENIQIASASTTICSLNEWNNLIFSVNKSGIWKIFLNNKDQLINVTFSPPNRNYNVKVLGRSSSSTNKNFYGLIDDLRIYNTVLTNNDIRILYESKYQTIYNLKITDNIFSDILIVGGGGSGGGTLGGGGGGGGLLYKKDNYLPINSYKLRVGKGGDRVQSLSNTNSDNYGNNGIYTSLIDTIVFGGGGGGSYQNGNGLDGGSGGGGGFQNGLGGLSIQPIYGDIIINGDYSGFDGTTVSNSTFSGDGGNLGILNSISGTQYIYSKGGTGSENNIDNNRTNSDGINYGDGGGGGGWANTTYSGKGGDGVVILKYKLKSFTTSNYIIDTIDNEKLSSGDLILLNNGGIRRVYNTTENYFTLFNEEENDIGIIPIGTNGYQKLNHLIKFTVNGDIDNGSIYINNDLGYSRLTVPFTGIFTVKLSVIFNLEFATEFCEFHIRLDRIGYKSRYIRTFYLPPISTYSHDFSSSLNTSVDLNLLENDILVFESNFKLSNIKKSYITFTNSGTTVVQGSLTQNIYNNNSSDGLVFTSPLVKVENTVQLDVSQLNLNYQFQSPLNNYNNVISISDSYYANYSHQHDASVITSGVLSIDRIPSLTSLYSSPTDIENTSNYIRNIDAKTSNIDIIDQDTINLNSKIGIQTNNVSHKVTITGDGDLIPENNSLAIISDSSPQMMLLGNQTSSQPSINLLYDYTNFNSSDITTFKGNQIVTTGQYFKIFSFNGDSNERFCIDSITGNVGIGTDNPNSKLDVRGSVYIEGNEQNTGVLHVHDNNSHGEPIARFTANGDGFILIENTKSDTDYDECGVVIKGSSTGGYWLVGTDDTSALEIKYDASDFHFSAGYGLSVATNGNVGIGTNNPGHKLDVNGDVNITGTLTTANLDVTGLTTTIHTDSYTTESLHIQSAGTDAVALKITHDTTSFNIMEVINSSANQVFTIDSNDNVGIGAISANRHETASVLHIDKGGTGSIHNLLTLRGGTSGQNNGGAKIYLGGDNDHFASIFSQHIGNGYTYLAFGTANGNTLPTERMRIDKDGNVGIGTITPTSKLHIVGTTRCGFITIVNNDSDDNQGMIYISSSGDKDLSFYCYSLTGEDQGISFNTDDGTTKMRIKKNGNVGIGNTNPLYKLDVNGNIYVGNNNYFLSGYADVGGSQYFGKYYTSRIIAGMEIQNTTLGGNYSQQLHFRTHQFGVDEGIRMTISESGNIGIGTTSPNYKLHIESSNPQILIGDSSAGSGQIYFGNSGHGVGRNTILADFLDGNDVVLYTAGSGGTGLKTSGGYLKVSSSGNVGIGTTSPSYKLDVNGSLNCTSLSVGGSLFQGGLWSSLSTMTSANDIYYNQETLSGSAYAYGSVVTISGNISDNSITSKMGLIVQHTNRTQALGIGYNGISQCGSTANLDLNLKAKGTGLTKIGTNNGTPLNVSQTRVGINTVPFTTASNANLSISVADEGTMIASNDISQFLWRIDNSANWGIYWSTNGSGNNYYIRTDANPNEIVFVGNGVSRACVDLNTGSICSKDWFRTFGNGGIYFSDYGGGWYMTDTTWIRSYGTKKVYIDSDLCTNGNIGIGTTTPGSKLDVNGAINCSSLTVNGVAITTNGGSSNNGISITTAGSATNSGTSVSANMGIYGSTYAYIDLRTNNNNGGWIDFGSVDNTDYKVRLRGYNSPQKLELVTGSNVTTIDASGNLLVPGDITAFYSDERLKKIKTNISDVLSNIDNINVFKYENNDLANSLGFKNDKLQIGLSAQEIQKYYPELVELAPFDTEYDVESGGNISKSGENYLTLKYDRLVPILLQGIKELNDKNKLLEEKNNKLENDLQLIKNKLGL